ncbi:MAG: gamma-glutamyltransferase [Planctomycetota bacterium]|nr:gamma-glutamyltransferase [Planctomycetota bacterium]
MEKGIVVAPEPMAAEVGADVLRTGGNAFDAAVAAGFMQMAVNPIQCGLGGWGGGTVFDARTGKSEHLGFWARIGEKMRPDMWINDIKGYTDVWHFALFDDDRAFRGYTSVMTPSTVAGFAELHARYCSKPWAELLQPSIDACREGFPLPEYMSSYLGGEYLPGLPTPKQIFSTTPDAVKLWMRDGDRFIQRGEHFANPDMAKTLERLAKVGPDDFYRGQIADTIVDAFEKNGAFVTRQDLAEYEVEKEAPLAGSYRGYDLETSTLPAGGIMLLQMLNALEHFDLASMEHNGPEHARLLAGAMAWAAVTRFNHLADPCYKDVPVEWLISKEFGSMLANDIRAGEMPTEEVLMKPGGTTHLCTMDAEGNCVTLTHTLTCYSGVVVPGTGFSWNNCVSLMDPIPGCNNSFDPGRARASALASTILLENGKPKIIVGAAGGWTITSAVLQAIINIVDFGMSATEAVSAPRFHSEGSPLFCESRIPQATIRELRSAGIKVEQSEYAYHWSFGRVQCIVSDGAQERFTGASDPRGDGGTAITAHGTDG